jgi:hypothetical protein
MFSSDIKSFLSSLMLLRGFAESFYLKQVELDSIFIKQVNGDNSKTNKLDEKL